VTLLRRAGIILAASCLLGMLAMFAWLALDRSRPGPTSDRPGSVELCGYGSTPPIRSTGDYPPEVSKTADATFAIVADALASHSQTRTQAVGLYAKLVAAMRRVSDENQGMTGDCADEPCQQRRWKLATEAARPHAQKLARLAVASQDPGAYALALYGCRLNRDDGACAQLSAAHWSELEPDNAVPWFYKAEEAASRKDEAALSEALLRASRAKTSDYHWSLVLAMAEHPAARELASAPRLVYLSQLLGIYAALPAPPYLAMSRACSADRMADSPRGRQCLDLATMMTERSRSLIEFSLGTSIGERGGWPPDRVQRLRDEIDAISFIGQSEMLAEDVHSCRFLELLEARIGELNALGELPSARRKVATSDRSTAVLAQGWRDLKQPNSNATNPGSRPK
jgi:hypothetical protein